MDCAQGGRQLEGAHHEPFGQLGQASRVDAALRRQTDDPIVHDLFAFDAQLRIETPHEWVEEQDRLEKLLGRIGEVVEAPDVRQLMEERRADLRLTEVGRKVLRQNDGGRQ